MDIENHHFAIIVRIDSGRFHPWGLSLGWERTVSWRTGYEHGLKLTLITYLLTTNREIVTIYFWDKMDIMYIHVWYFEKSTT